MKKHILVIFFDQLRYDCIGANGNPYIMTPALDAIAAESQRFTRCMTPSPVCVPARLSMMAGQYAARTGNSNNNPDLAYQGKGFYSAITESGYDSCNVGKMHYVWDKFGNLGFKKRHIQEPGAKDEYHEFIRNSPYKTVFDLDGHRSEMYYVPQVSQLPQEYHTSNWVGERSIDFLDGCDPEKDNIFMFTSIFQPHPPFSPPSPWNKIYRDYEGIEPVRPSNPDPLTFEKLLYDRFRMDRLGISEIDLKRLRNFYYACVSFGDYQVSRIIAKLKEKGMYDDTLIIVTSDHGEMLGDYRTMGKRTMFNGACRIPMLIRVPGMEPSVRNDPASLVDLAPTILSWAGIDYDPAEYDGVDLLKEKHTEVYSQYESGNKGVYMVCDECDKLIYNAKEEMYYYLKDHDETVNKYKACQDDEKVLALKEKLDAYVASDKGSASPTAVQVADQPFGIATKDNKHTIMEEFARVPDEYRLKLGNGGPAKTREKYRKSLENKKKNKSEKE